MDKQEVMPFWIGEGADVAWQQQEGQQKMEFKTTQGESAYIELKIEARKAKEEVERQMGQAMTLGTDIAVTLQTALSNSTAYMKNMEIAYKTAVEIDLEIYRTEALLKDAITNNETEH